MVRGNTDLVNDDVLGFYPEETRSLIAGYMKGIRTEHDRKARERIFADFFIVTGRDLLHADSSAFAAYASTLRNRVESGRIKLNTALKNQRVLSAFAAYVVREKRKGNPNVPSGFEDRTLLSRIEEPPEEIHFREVPSLTEMDKLIGYLKGRKDDQTLAAVLLAYKCFLKTGEIIGLKKGSILCDNDGFTYVMIGVELPIRIPDDVAGVLDQCLGNIPDGGYVISRKGKRISQAALQKRIRCACVRSGINGYTLNALRNAGTVTAISAGADSVKLCDDMRYKTRAHIRRLTSLPIKFSDVSEYVNIQVKPGI
ncbi:MAG: site-specific integrase [Lachnospiraceae bacterium]|nr:site-specific integrase [Lachnospiraceae bacterium]